MRTYNHSFVKIKHKYRSEKCENLRLLKSRIFRNNIRIKIKEIRRLKLHIPTNISLGTEMKSKIGRMIKHTDIRRVVKMCIEFLVYPNYCLLVPKQCRLESRPVSLFQMSYLWMQSAT